MMGRVMILVLAVIGSVMACTAAGEIVVEGQWGISRIFFNSRDLSRLVAWRQGDCYFAREKRGKLFVQIDRVVEGDLPKDTYRRFGKMTVYVIAMNDASLALGTLPERHEDVKGTWRLTPMPDGNYAVFTLDDVPESLRPAGTQAKVAVQALAVALKAKEPQVAADALYKISDSYYFNLIPQIMPLLGSKARVKPPEDADLDDPEWQELTLGRVALQALYNLASCIDESGTEKSTAAEWRAWWMKILAVTPYPKVTFTPGPLTDIGTQTDYRPTLYMSPDGGQVVGAYQYQEEVTEEDKHCGLQLFNLADGTNTWLYHQEGRLNQPFITTVAWDVERMGAVYLDMLSRDDRTLRFVTTDRKGQPRYPIANLGLFGVETLKLCAVEGGWLLVMNKPDRTLWLQRLTDRGERDGALVKVTLPQTLTKSNRNSSLPRFTITNTKAGPAISCFLSPEDDHVLYLVLLNPDLTVRKVVNVLREEVNKQVGDHTIASDSKLSRIDPSGASLCANGETIAVVWSGRSMEGFSVVARTFDLEGNPRSPIVLIGENTRGAAPPVPCGTGFAVGYTCEAETPDQAHVVTLAGDGTCLGSYFAYAGSRNRGVEPLALGVRGTTAFLLMCDHSRYPFPLTVKQMEVQTGK